MELTVAGLFKHLSDPFMEVTEVGFVRSGRKAIIVSSPRIKDGENYTIWLDTHICHYTNTPEEAIVIVNRYLFPSNRSQQSVGEQSEGGTDRGSERNDVLTVGPPNPAIIPRNSPTIGSPLAVAYDRDGKDLPDSHC